MVTQPWSSLGPVLAAALLVASCAGAPATTGQAAAAPTAADHAETTRQRELRACVAVCRRDHALEKEAREKCRRRCLDLGEQSDDQANPDADSVPWGLVLAITVGSVLSVLTQLF